MVNSRSKGARAEREVVNLLKEHGFTDAVRNYDQAAVGGADILTVKEWSIEIKNRATVYQPTWWLDAVEKTPKGCKTALVYRVPNMPLARRWVVEVRLSDVAEWFGSDAPLHVDLETIENATVKMSFFTWMAII